MKQIVVIHGGDSFQTYDAYLDYLRNRNVTADYFKGGRSWKDSLAERLGSNYEIFQPHMPNKQNAKYIEWKIWLEKLIPFLDNEIILVGHSLGASFLTRYLSEERSSKGIRATFLVASPHDADNTGTTPEFAAPKSLSLFGQQGGKIFLYYSKDDPIVPFAELAKYQKALPNATARVFSDRGHFNQETFPELVADIKSI